MPASPLSDEEPVRSPDEEPVRQRSLRTHNLGLVLRYVATSRHPISRAGVAAATGLTRATVSSIVDELLSSHLLTEVEPPPQTRAGRPATGLRLAASGPAGLGLEINIDYLSACVVDLTGQVRCHEVRRAPQRGRDPQDVLADVARLGYQMASAVADEDLTVAGATLAVPGLVTDGVLRLAPNLSWPEFDVRVSLSEHVTAAGLPLAESALTVDNEANLAALGELDAAALADPGKRRASFLYISGEIGVGSGIVLDGTLLRGRRGFAGELGHLTIRPDGPRCHCGARGCLEAYANQETLLRRAGLHGDDPVSSLAQLADLANRGQDRAVSALTDVGSALGVAAAAVVNLVDIDTVVLGGIYAPLAQWLSGPVTHELSDRVLASRWNRVTVRASLLGDSATVVGAAGCVVRRIRESPGSWITATANHPALTLR